MEKQNFKIETLCYKYVGDKECPHEYVENYVAMKLGEAIKPFILFEQDEYLDGHKCLIGTLKIGVKE